MAHETHETIDRGDCPHLARLEEPAASDAEACETCGGTEHLRRCLACGYVGCCESTGAHDHDHWDETGHPLITPHRQDYDFLWCWACGAYLD